MKTKNKTIYLTTILPVATLPLLSISCKETEEQRIKREIIEKLVREEKLTLEYKKRYIDQNRYVFDDFEPFKIKKEYFNEPENINKPGLSVKKGYSFKSIDSNANKQFIFDDFDKWYKEFEFKFNVFKKIINKYNKKNLKIYTNKNNLKFSNIKLYYVKETEIDFEKVLGRGVENAIDDYLIVKLLAKLFKIPNLKLNCSFLDYKYFTSQWLKEFDNFEFKNYYSSINLQGFWDDKNDRIYEDMKKLFAIPKPFFKGNLIDTNSYNDDLSKLTFKSYFRSNYTFWNSLFIAWDGNDENLRQENLKKYGNDMEPEFLSYLINIQGAKHVYLDQWSEEEFYLRVPKKINLDDYKE
ncbi:hypothetical protein DMC14_002825 [Metamycoplasma phocicerebrale]|uniref:Lipoprotein n=1 Tax=Metamycoplasma phocicerebrale TaxID=142649 RepID=A0A3T0TUI9_9BACT|nr:hypothetical protein [Metamycoplasma phocicerebrale]AZZ65700.1 hypothetical protein DMC14_002825 [Metamycoplasma phocicerebrale]